MGNGIKCDACGNQDITSFTLNIDAWKIYKLAGRDAQGRVMLKLDGFDTFDERVIVCSACGDDNVMADEEFVYLDD
jgi:hypothetical protein